MIYKKVRLVAELEDGTAEMAETAATAARAGMAEAGRRLRMAAGVDLRVPHLVMSQESVEAAGP